MPKHQLEDQKSSQQFKLQKTSTDDELVAASPSTSESSPSSTSDASSILGPAIPNSILTEELKLEKELENEQGIEPLPPQLKPKYRRVKKIDGKWVIPTVPTDETVAARKLLKEQGMIPFLDTYLSDDPKGSDLMYVIVLLGFFSFSFEGDIDDEKNLLKIIKLLQKAMNKVMYMRERLPEFNKISDVVQALSNSNKILVLTGAGISTSLGIPDFRSSQGIYSKVKHLGLSDPQEVFDIHQFHDNPDIFYTVAHMILPPADSFTPLHSFIKLLESKGKLLRNYTQNIDNLEGNVGISPEKVIQCHGSFATATCQTCKHQVEGSKIYKYIRATELPICPFCFKDRQKKFEKDENYYPQSFGVMKPDITFFGENLPKDFHESIKKDVMDCDLLLCIGTSLKVSPVSEIVNMVPDSVPQILINKDLIEHAEFDVSFLGYCDQVAVYLTEKLGWKLNHENVEKIENEGLNLIELNPEIGLYEILNDDQKKKLENKSE